MESGRGRWRWRWRGINGLDVRGLLLIVPSRLTMSLMSWSRQRANIADIEGVVVWPCLNGAEGQLCSVILFSCFMWDVCCCHLVCSFVRLFFR